MGDLFYDKHAEAETLAVFAGMARAPWHRYQVLTKRRERMAAMARSRA